MKGTTLSNGKQIDSEGTFISESVTNSQKFLMICGSAPRINPKVWVRGHRVTVNNCIKCHHTKSDAIIFKAKADVVIVGFLWNGERDSRDFTLKF